MNKPIYLDYAAATPLLPEVSKIVNQISRKNFHNPSALYLAAIGAKNILEDSRKICAQILSVKPAEIIFTSGATESINLAIKGLPDNLKSSIAISATEHESVVNAATSAFRKVEIVEVDSSGNIKLESLKKSIKPDTSLVSIAYANSEIGTVQSMRKIKHVIQAIQEQRNKTGNKTPLYFHSDASAAANSENLHVSKLGVDLLSLGGAKIYGPNSSGLLYVNNSLTLSPLISGGGQERGIRSGTPDVAQIAGLAEALRIVQSEKDQENHRLSQLKTRFIKKLTQVEGMTINAQSKHTLPNIVSFTLPRGEGERMVMELDELGVQLATGAACSARSNQPSKTLLAIGLNKSVANKTLRISLGRGTNWNELSQAADKIISLVK